MGKVELELITDPDICIFSEKGMRGGVFYISNRYSKANNKYLKSSDPKQDLKHIIYLDSNNLCGYVMPKFLPTTGLKWRDPKEFDLNKYTSNSSKWSVLKLDLEYPKELQKWHYDYPSSPDKIGVKREMLFDYQSKTADFYNIPIGSIKN